MAIGNYRIASETYRPTHVSAGNATVGRTQLPDVAGMFGSGFANTIKAGINYYQGVQEVGKSLQQIGHKVSSWEADSAMTSLTSEWGS